MNTSSLPTQIRDVIKQLSPPFLSQGNAEKFMYTIGLCSDLLLEKANQAVKIRIPGQGDATQLPYLSQDRVLVQGPAEDNASFAGRLKAAFPAWRKAGSRQSILLQLQAYLQNLQPGVAAVLPEMLIVGGNYASPTSVSTWDTIYNGDSIGAPPSRQVVSPANWNWDGRNQPWRAWLVLFMQLVPTGQSGTAASVASKGGSGVPGVTSGFAQINGLSGLLSSNVQQYLTLSRAGSGGNNGTFQIQSVISSTQCLIANPSAVAPDGHNGAINWSIGQYPYIAPAPVWGSPSFVWGAGTWGLSCSPQVVQSIRGILKTWKSAGTYYPNIVISFGGGDGTAGAEFSPNSSQGSGNPDGTWGSYGKLVNGVWVPAKTTVSAFTAFPDGTGQYVDCNEQNVT